MAENENIVLVTVATFPEAIEAHIYRNRLEAEGIPAVLADENIVSNQPWHSIAYGGVKLRVRAQDAEQAKILIQQIRHGNSNPAPIAAEVCPACGSDNIKLKRNANFFSGVLTLLLGAPVRRSKATCANCGHQWQLT